MAHLSHRLVVVVVAYAAASAGLAPPERPLSAGLAPPERPVSRRGWLGGGAVALIASPVSAAPSRKAPIAELKAALLAAIPATATGRPATNVTEPAAAPAVERAAVALEAAAGARKTSRDGRLEGGWRLVYSDAPEITNLASLPAGFRLGPVYQPFDLQSGTFENQGKVLHATGLVRASTRVVGEFSRARPGTVNAAGVVNDRDDRVDVVFRRVVFQLDGVAGRPVTNVRKVVSPRPDPTLAQPAVDVTFIDDDLRVTRGGDGALFVLRREPSPPMLGASERRAIYDLDASDVTSGAGLTNWSKTTSGVIAGKDDAAAFRYRRK